MKIKINGMEIEAREGETILQAARRAGINIPTLCYFEGIFNEATCRICVVELSNGKVVPSCAYPVSKGLEVYTDTRRIKSIRRMVLELILSIHKIKCQSCPMKGGECKLVELCKEYGVEGIPVCSECPLNGDECLLAQGKVCLGPITMSGCNAVCTRERRTCEGCRGPITRSDVLKEAIETYKRYGISVDEVLEEFGKYCSSFPAYDKVVGIIRREYNED